MAQVLLLESIGTGGHIGGYIVYALQIGDNVRQRTARFSFLADGSMKMAGETKVFWLSTTQE